MYPIPYILLYCGLYPARLRGVRHPDYYCGAHQVRWNVSGTSAACNPHYCEMYPCPLHYCGAYPALLWDVSRIAACIPRPLPRCIPTRTIAGCTPHGEEYPALRGCAPHYCGMYPFPDILDYCGKGPALRDASSRTLMRMCEIGLI